MRKEPDPAKRLLLDLLNGQPEPPRRPPLSQQRLRAALTDGPPLDADERRELFLSPVSRADYLRLKRRLNAELRARWQRRGARLQLVAAAAADAASDELSYRNADAGFELTLYRQDDDDMPWMALLRLDAALRDTLYPSSQITLTDSGGLEWARGRPDARGELSFGWYDAGNDPLERLRLYTLLLDLA